LFTLKTSETVVTSNTWLAFEDLEHVPVDVDSLTRFTGITVVSWNAVLTVVTSETHGTHLAVRAGVAAAAG
jgi:hypothetical protein